MNEYLPFFFGPQAEYYTRVAEDLDEGKSRFNEGAFFFGMFWMAYRKMYANAAITFGIIMTESALENRFIPQLSATFAYSLASNVLIGSVLGFMGNRLYIRHARNQLAAISPSTTAYTNPDPDVVAQLRSQGGVSWISPMVLLLAFILLTGSVFLLTM